MSQPITSNQTAALDEEHLFLSEDDVERLLKDNSSESRIRVMQKISSQYVGHLLSETELLYAEQIFRALLHDAEVQVRRALSESLKNADAVPRDIIIGLAQDREEVALPVIRSSQVLSDADLIRIIESSREVAKIDSVASRDKVSGRVSRALVETHYPQVVKTLLENENASIEAREYEAIMHDHSDNRSITDAMARREALPIPIVEKLIHHVSDSLIEEIEEKYGIDLEEAKQKTRESVTLQLIPQSTSDEEIDVIVQQMLMYERLTPSIILSSLCQGNIRFFEIALARIAKIPRPNARKLIRDKGLLGFEALYEKTEMPASTFDAVRLLLQIVIELEKEEDLIPGSTAYANKVIEALLHRAEENEIENLSYIMALVRQSIVH